MDGANLRPRCQFVTDLDVSEKVEIAIFRGEIAISLTGATLLLEGVVTDLFLSTFPRSRVRLPPQNRW
jgi:hypothetical protein